MKIRWIGEQEIGFAMPAEKRGIKIREEEFDVG
jgi:hypothetical protein